MPVDSTLPRTLLGAVAGRLGRRPEAWLRPLLLLAVCLTLGWALGDARWVFGFGDLTPFFAAATSLGFILALVAARAGWSRWQVHLAAGAAGALGLPIIVGAMLEPGATPVVGWFQATADSATAAALDLLVRRTGLTGQRGHVLLLLGMECWAVGQLAGRVAGHGLARRTIMRPLPMAGPTLVVGALVVANIVQIRRDQLEILVAFTGTALLLVAVERLAESREQWRRWGFGAPRRLGTFHLGIGGGVLAIALVASTALGQAANGRPLGNAAQDVSQRVQVFADRFARHLPVPRLNRQGSRPEPTFTGRWITTDEELFRIRLPDGARPEGYWLLATYDVYTPRGWLASESGRRDVAAGESLANGYSSVEVRSEASTTTARVRPAIPGDRVVISAGLPRTVDRPVRSIAGAGGSFGTLELVGAPVEYSVTAQEPYRARTGASAEDLRAAGTDYPAEILEHYLNVPRDTIAPDSAAARLLADLRFSSGNATPYDLAAWTERLLTSASFTYSADVQDLCGDLDLIECLARNRTGYCVQYASAMAILLRELNVPTRVVTGFLPGAYDRRTEETIVRGRDSHSWVQVYFPGIGWVDFDPTSGGRDQLPRIAESGTLTTPSPRPSDGPRASRAPRPSPSRSASPTSADAAGTTGTGRGPSLDSVGPAVAALAMVSIGGLGWVVRRRRRRSGTGATRGPSDVFAGIVRLASRLGFQPRPSDTVYEYAGALGAALPNTRPALELVAHATVEARYARRLPESELLAAIVAAERRLRRALLRLVFSRRRR
jgi:transglutaminase-like putative cysteine protease